MSTSAEGVTRRADRDQLVGERRHCLAPGRHCCGLRKYQIHLIARQPLERGEDRVRRDIDVDPRMQRAETGQKGWQPVKAVVDPNRQAHEMTPTSAGRDHQLLGPRQIRQNRGCPVRRILPPRLGAARTPAFGKA